MARLNVQAFVASYLRDAMPSAEVAVRVPDPRPERLVVVRRAGGGMANSLQDRAGVHLIVYGGSEWETSELAGEASDLMMALNRSDDAMLSGVSRVVEESIRSDPDTQTQPDTPRWFGSYTLTTHSYQ